MLNATVEFRLNWYSAWFHFPAGKIYAGSELIKAAKAFQARTKREATLLTPALVPYQFDLSSEADAKDALNGKVRQALQERFADCDKFWSDSEFVAQGEGYNQLLVDITSGGSVYTGGNRRHLSTSNLLLGTEERDEEPVRCEITTRIQIPSGNVVENALVTVEMEMTIENAVDKQG